MPLIIRHISLIIATTFSLLSHFTPLHIFFAAIDIDIINRLSFFLLMFARLSYGCRRHVGGSDSIR